MSPTSIFLFILITLFSFHASCTSEPTSKKEKSNEHTYQTKGTIRSSLKGDPKMMRVEHDPIPQFKNAQGQVVGMKSMTMPFQINPEISLNDLQAGDRIEFTFKVEWSPHQKIEIINLKHIHQESTQ